MLERVRDTSVSLKTVLNTKSSYGLPCNQLFDFGLFDSTVSIIEIIYRPKVRKGIHK